MVPLAFEPAGKGVEYKCCLGKHVSPNEPESLVVDPPTEYIDLQVTVRCSEEFAYALSLAEAVMGRSLYLRQVRGSEAAFCFTFLFRITSCGDDTIDWRTVPPTPLKRPDKCERCGLSEFSVVVSIGYCDGNLFHLSPLLVFQYRQ